MRIVHVLNYQLNKSGQAFANCDHKIHHGLIQNRHYVYSFSYNDVARQLHWSGSKKPGAKAANRSLIETCHAVQPDLLLLAHAQNMEPGVLATLRKAHPNLKIAQWYVDALEYREKTQFLRDRLPYLDAVFATTAGERLNEFTTPTCSAHFFPNPVLESLEVERSFAEKTHDYDLLFIGTDDNGKDLARAEFLREVQESLPSHIRFGIFGSLGQPRADGSRRDELIKKSKAALNLTRYQPRKYYSSDRVAQIMGNGSLACVDRGFDLHELYGEDSLLSFQSAGDLAKQLAELIDSGEWKTRAKQGWEVSHAKFNAKTVTAEMLVKIFHKGLTNSNSPATNGQIS